MSDLNNIKRGPIMFALIIGMFATRTEQAISNRSGEGFVDTAVEILMAVVIGALVLAGLYMLSIDKISLFVL